MSGAASAAKFHLLDAVALVVGYGLASMLVRSYWPHSSPPSFWEGVFITVVFVWVGLAMSGPLVLLIRRPATANDGRENRDRPPIQRSWAELAWLMIGAYWLAMTILVVPWRMHGLRSLDGAFVGLLPIVFALLTFIFGPAALRRTSEDRAWTHAAGIWLIIAWPIAWVALIVLGRTLL